MVKRGYGFTLIELILVVAIVTTLALIVIPSYSKFKAKSISKEAVSNLRLLAAAERLYKVENNFYATCSCVNSGDCGAAATGCNSLLRLMLNTNNWLYTVTGNTSAVTATATSGGCVYSISSSNFDLEPQKSGGCP